ncbi:MAG: hypothetical protein K1Y36_12360 [Blastocatellia bacterium]|nr:hypothetical protein [Blastocatellia bacterium]
MQIEITKDGTSFQLDITRENGQLQAQIGETRHIAEVLQPEPNLYVFRIGNQVLQTRVASRDDGKVDVMYAGKRNVVQVLDRRRRDASTTVAEGPQPVTSPMPGRVVRLLAAVGDEVEAGQGVVVVEAMKMQNEMGAGKAGKVIEICVTEGQTVKGGETLAVIE